ncbi:MAG: hypothetical protein WC935_00310 [Thermoleophilia bacterium]
MRCFVLGNGPSLAKTNLNLLVNEVSFGVNQCHLIYPLTKWRPTYWVCTDRDLQMPIDEWAELFFLHRDLGEHCFIAPRHFTRMGVWDIQPTARFEKMDLCMEHGTRIGHGEWWPKSWHLPQLCVFGGSVLTTIQLAVTMGFDEVYLLGCDLIYRPGENNHFSEDYFNFRPYDPEWAAYLTGAQAYAHELANRECIDRGIVIMNAGVGGALEVYPRASLEEVCAAS